MASPAGLPARESARGELNRRLSGSVPVTDEYLRWPLPGARAATSPAQAPYAAQAAQKEGRYEKSDGRRGSGRDVAGRIRRSQPRAGGAGRHAAVLA